MYNSLNIYFLFDINRDASYLMNPEYYVTVEECVNALYKAKWYGFFDMSDFDLEEYEKYEVKLI